MLRQFWPLHQLTSNVSRFSTRAWSQYRPGLVGIGLGIPVLGALILVPLIRSQANSNPNSPPRYASSQVQLNHNQLALNSLTTPPTTPIPSPFLGQANHPKNPRPLLQSRDLLNPRLRATPPATPLNPTRTSANVAITPPPALKPVAPSQANAPQVRVAVVHNQAQVTIGVNQDLAITDDQGRVLGTLAANQGLTLKPGGQGFLGWSQPLPPSIWLNPGTSGLVYVDGHWYRGKMRVISVDGQVSAINQLDLEQYVVSVVGAEVYPSWPLHTLKAQAIAARSYALAQMFKPASRFFDLGNTQRWQVYRGIKDEWNTGQTAVQATRGIVLTKSGRVMVSMYAATDDIVRDVFGGRGMSQTGAYELGKQGYSYLQILGYYYPGASLSTLSPS